MRPVLAVLVLTGCFRATPATPPPTDLAPTTGASPEAAGMLPPVVLRAPQDPACPLDWSELLANAPPSIRLHDDEHADCPAEPICDPWDDADDWCERAVMHGGRTAFVHGRGPGGSGHFVQLALAIDDTTPHYACLDGSTVGWRALLGHARSLAPLPWIGDVDGDGEAELVLWQRLPWGSAEVTNALYPVPYALSGNLLVRRDDRGAALRARVAAAYRDAATTSSNEDLERCFEVLGHLDDIDINARGPI